MTIDYYCSMATTKKTAQYVKSTTRKIQKSVVGSTENKYSKHKFIEVKDEKIARIFNKIAGSNRSKVIILG